jgi:uncharacterized membrane protein YccF (DUF307 family)
MRILGNLIWLLFGGIVIALEYFVASFVLIISIIGIPLAKQHFKLAGLALTPFGREVVSK